MADHWLDLRTQVQKTIDGLVVSGREIGVQVAAYLNGRLIVNAVAGLADAATGNPVTPDTPFFSFSTGKGLAGTAVHVLAERGEISYDLRLAEVWPEYARHGKEQTTLRHVLTHSAGVPQLPSFTTAEDMLDWDRMCRTIASSVPLWEPGARHGYHAWTYGWLVGETVRRVTGRPISRVLAEDIARPLHADRELFFGVPDRMPLTHLARLKDRNWSASMETLSGHLPNFDRIAPPGVRPDAGLGNRRDVLRADIPAVGTVSARGHRPDVRRADGRGGRRPVDLPGPAAPDHDPADHRPGLGVRRRSAQVPRVSRSRWAAPGSGGAGWAAAWPVSIRPSTWPWPARRTTWARTTATRWKGWPSSSGPRS